MIHRHALPRLKRLWAFVALALVLAIVPIGSDAPAQAAGTNLALGKPTTQSSSYWDGAVSHSGSMAVDGNRNGRWSSTSPASTNFDTNAWWQVDLGSVQTIPTVRIYGRTDCCVERLSNFSVFVSDVPFTSTNITTTRNQAGVSEYSMTGNSDTFVNVNVGRTGRYIRVQLHGTDYLSLAEVEVGPTSVYESLKNEPDQIWGVTGLGSSFATNMDAQVLAIEQIGNTIYVGGKFLNVVERRDRASYPQSFLAAFDATTGAWIDWWRPSVNGLVHALEASPDGTRLFVGGEFTSVDGLPNTHGFVSLDPSTGEVQDDFVVTVETPPNVVNPGVVREIRAGQDWLYIGGSFNYITGPTRNSRTYVWKIARVDLDTAMPDPNWRPIVSGGGVWGIVEDTARGRVHFVGDYNSVNSNTVEKNLTTVYMSNGQIVPGLVVPINTTPSQDNYFDIEIAGGRLWLAGTQHEVKMLDIDTRQEIRRWFSGYDWSFSNIGGDYQALGVSADGTRVYASCHCWGAFREIGLGVTSLSQGQSYPLYDVSPSYPIRSIQSFDAVTGDYLSSWKPRIEGSVGGWALHGAPDGCLWAGGDFNRASIGDVYNNGVVRFCDTAGQGAPVAPSLVEPPDNTEANSPQAPTNVTVDITNVGDALIRWDDAVDDTGVAYYRIYRDDALLVSTRLDSYLDVGYVPGHMYGVQAVDVFGNLSGIAGEGAGVPPVVSSPGTQTSTVGVADSVVISASDADGDPLTYAATGLPGGMSIDAATGVISGTPTTEGSYTVVVSVSDGLSTVTTSFSWTVSSFVAGTYPGAVEGDGAIAYWRLGDQGAVAADEFGLADATYQGGPALGAGALVKDGDPAVDFDGVDDLVAVPDTAAINTGGPYEQRSVELWFKADDVNRRAVLFEEGSTSRGLSVYVDGGNLWAGAWNRNNDGDGTTPWAQDAFVSTPVAGGLTYHAVVVFDQPSGAFTLYVNGAQVAQATGVGRLFGHGGDIGIGGQNDNARYHNGGDAAGDRWFFDGVIDDVSVANVALSATQVQDHYLAGASDSQTYDQTVLADVPAAYWRLDEPAGSTTVVDLTGGNDAPVSGAAVLGWSGLITGSGTALSGNGTDAFVSVPDASELNTGGPYEAKTVEAWIRPADVTATQVVYEQGATSRGLNVYVEGGQIWAGIWNRNNDGDGTTPWAQDVWLSAPISANQTYHVVLVYDFANSRSALYLNGAEVASATGMGRLFGHGGDIGIGAQNNDARFATRGDGAGDRWFFNGVIDEVATYNSALSTEAIQTHYLLGS